MAINYLKQFTGWVTDLKNNLFLWTRFKLTLLYMIFISVILVIFSIGLYLSIEKNIHDNISDKIKEKVIRELVITQTENQLRDEFIIGDILLLLVSSGLAFFMAEKNLWPIQRAMKKQSQFTADASHDLRTPLAIIKTDCEVNLKKKNASIEEFRELVKSNLEEVNRMSAMVEQLLFLSRNNEMPAKQMELVPLGQLAEKMVANFQSLAGNKNIALTICETSEGNILGNQLDLERMFFNILKNAIDYTPSGGKIEVAVKKDGHQMKLFLTDTGIGISAEDLSHITEAFYKADKVRGQEKS